MFDLKYAYNQLNLAAGTAKQFNFNIVGGKATGTYRFVTGFYGLAVMPAEFQKAMDRTINHAKELLTTHYGQNYSTLFVFWTTFALCRKVVK